MSAHYLGNSWIVLLLLTACATTVTPRIEIESAALLQERHIQRNIALQQNVRDSSRIQDVSFPLLEAAVPFCAAKVTRSIGLDVVTVYDYAASFQSSAREVLSAGMAVSIVSVASYGPAAEAGMQSKDIITAVNDNPLVTGPNATAIFDNLLREEMASGEPIKISVRRGEQTLELQVTPLMVCDYPVALVLSDELNAYADGHNVYITRRMLRFTDSDKELALVIAHELAHNIMGHIDKRQQNSLIGTIIDLAVNSQGFNTQGYFSDLTGNAYSHAFEAEADYVGMYILARTGMDLDGASYFWRRMAVESPANIDSHTSSHPATAERFLALEQAVTEISQKKESGVPLNPELK